MITLNLSPELILGPTLPTGSKNGLTEFSFSAFLTFTCLISLNVFSGPLKLFAVHVYNTNGLPSRVKKPNLYFLVYLNEGTGYD